MRAVFSPLVLNLLLKVISLLFRRIVFLQSINIVMESGSNVTSCGCKGIRVCLQCEANKKQIKTQALENVAALFQEYVYCHVCCKAWELLPHPNEHPYHQGNTIDFPGVCIIPEFVTTHEEKLIVDEIDCSQWKESQSGRLKQDYGPKVNFKKKKVRMQQFTGLPAFSSDLYKRMISLETLKTFIPVELCNLDYDPSRGSAIDPHFDDFWLWGERLVTLNLLSDSYLAMTIDYSDERTDASLQNTLVRIPLLQRSLVVLQGDARHIWKHSIPRGAIVSRRVAITWRELSDEFQDGGSLCEQGKKLIERALSFQGLVVQ
ncbi:alpha-ketoglutarate-dependent dioxygenase alkB homolog 4-like [Antedon mediterranea]|uniref:alpha-ketoglutarate-dependent dioxygenase alkB homolog 4-like n=1 Tax=Antedon mediterranea TaxID=105859 RepID=UPI003AF5A0A8